MRFIFIFAVLFASFQLKAAEKSISPMALLEKSNEFAPGAVGYGGTASEEAVAFRKILKSPNAKTQFKKLYRSERLVTKLYGLGGLYFTDKKAFKKGLATLKNNQIPISMRQGCSAGSTTVASLINNESISNFSSGYIPLELAGEGEKLVEIVKAFEKRSPKFRAAQ